MVWTYEKRSSVSGFTRAPLMANIFLPAGTIFWLATISSLTISFSCKRHSISAFFLQAIQLSPLHLYASHRESPQHTVTENLRILMKVYTLCPDTLIIMALKSELLTMSKPLSKACSPTQTSSHMKWIKRNLFQTNKIPSFFVISFHFLNLFCSNSNKNTVSRGIQHLQAWKWRHDTRKILVDVLH